MKKSGKCVHQHKGIFGIILLKYKMCIRNQTQITFLFIYLFSENPTDAYETRKIYKENFSKNNKA